MILDSQKKIKKCVWWGHKTPVNSDCNNSVRQLYSLGAPDFSR